MKSTTRLAPLLLLLGIAAPWQGKSAQSSTQSSASQEAKTGKQQRARKKPELPVLPGDKAKDKPLPSASKTDSAIRRALEGASAAEISRKDLVQRFPKKNPLLGVWRVTKTFRNQANSAAITTGYVIFTKAYCSLHLFREAAFANSKAFQVLHAQLPASKATSSSSPASSASAAAPAANRSWSKPAAWQRSAASSSKAPASSASTKAPKPG